MFKKYSTPLIFCQAVKIKTLLLACKRHIQRNRSEEPLHFFKNIGKIKDRLSGSYLDVLYYGICFHQYEEFKLSVIFSSTMLAKYIFMDKPSYLFVIQQFGVFMDSGSFNDQRNINWKLQFQMNDNIIEKYSYKPRSN